MGCHPRSKKPSCQKAFRDRDRALLERIACGESGNLWRSPMLEAMKRAGAKVHMDEKRRLQIVFGDHALHPCRLELGHTEDCRYANSFGQKLQALARALLTHKLSIQGS